MARSRVRVVAASLCDIATCACGVATCACSVATCACSVATCACGRRMCVVVWQRLRAVAAYVCCGNILNQCINYTTMSHSDEIRKPLL